MCGNKEGKFVLRNGIQQNGAEWKSGWRRIRGLWGRTACRRYACGAVSPAEFRRSRNVRPPHYERRAAFERARTMLRMRFFTNERRTVSRCGPSTNMKKRPAGRLYICTSVILLFHPVRRKDSFLPDPVQRGWALLRHRDFLLLPPEWVPPAVLFGLSGSSEPSTHFQSSR